jgi:hypothetical protein
LYFQLFLFFSHQGYGYVTLCPFHCYEFKRNWFKYLRTDLEIYNYNFMS